MDDHSPEPVLPVAPGPILSDERLNEAIDVWLTSHAGHVVLHSIERCAADPEALRIMLRLAFKRGFRAAAAMYAVCP